MANFGVVVFPGSNCDHDAYHAMAHIFNENAQFLWHKDTSLNGVDVILIPGGFSYGDYLRSGSIARFSPIMEEVVDFAREGGIVMGICNGFQILLEAGLLPGAMQHNQELRFICKQTYIRCINNKTPFTNHLNTNKALQIPVAHAEGNYYADEETLRELYENNQIVFQYCNNTANITEKANINGSVDNIAGICNKEGNVLGLMPHPERAVEKALGSSDGRAIFESLLDYLSVTH